LLDFQPTYKITFIMKHSLRLKLICILIFSFFIFNSCDKEDSGISEEEQQEMNEDPANTEGRFSGNLSCTIIAVPIEVGLSNYYTKYINCSGIPVIGSAAVPDEALLIASETVEFMLSDLGNVRAKLISEGNYIALYPDGGSISDLPEDFFVGGPFSTGAYSYTNTFKAVASDTASLLCNPDAGYGHTLVHEIGHMIDGGALRFLESDFTSQQTSLYDQAIASGKWNNTYASTNPLEWLAEGIAIWYGVNWIGPEGGDGARNNIGTRAQLQTYDPGLYNLINAHYNNKTEVPGCRQAVIEGTTANCPGTVMDVDGNSYTVVNIGPMCWLKENLKTTKFNDGTPIQNISENSDWQNTTVAAWANFDNDESNVQTYGRLYNGYALSNNRQLCPTGWRVPTIQELQDLANFAGGDYASGNLKTITLWDAPNTDATNSSGFSAVPAGTRQSSGSFQALGGETFFGSSALKDSKFYSKSIFANQERVYTALPELNTGVSCRCIKD